MLEEDFILRRLPTALIPAQRMLLETLVFSIDIVDHARQTLVEIASSKTEGDLKFSTRERAAMFSAAWTIVDHIQMARHVFSQLIQGELGPKFARFNELGSQARRLRNRMDHLTEMTSGLAAAKKRRAPIFGALGYLWIRPQDVEQTSDGLVVKGGMSVLIQTGIVDGRDRMSIVNPAGRKIAAPISHFQLNAFDHDFPLEEAADLLDELVRDVGQQIEEQMPDKAAEAASKTGHSVTDYTAHGAGGLVVALYFEANREMPPGEAS